MTEKRWKYIYGPVSSWRLGRSLGIDPVFAGEGKICSFDCVYCQVSRTRLLTAKRKVFVPTEKILDEVRSLPPLEIDYITLSGAGEPTLAKNLGEIIKGIREIRETAEGSPGGSRGDKIAVLTNSSIMDRKDVRDDLSLADFVIAKLDAPSLRPFAKINRPAKAIKLDKIVNGLRKFRSQYKGRLALQIMFIKENKDYADEIADLARVIKPDEVQINTPLRPCAAAALSKEELEGIKRSFKGMNVITVYDAEKKAVEPLSRKGTLIRRGKI